MGNTLSLSLLLGSAHGLTTLTESTTFYTDETCSIELPEDFQIYSKPHCGKLRCEWQRCERPNGDGYDMSICETQEYIDQGYTVVTKTTCDDQKNNPFEDAETCTCEKTTPCNRTLTVVFDESTPEGSDALKEYCADVKVDLMEMLFDDEDPTCYEEEKTNEQVYHKEVVTGCENVDVTAEILAKVKRSFDDSKDGGDMTEDDLVLGDNQEGFTVTTSAFDDNTCSGSSTSTTESTLLTGCHQSLKDGIPASVIYECANDGTDSIARNRFFSDCVGYSDDVDECEAVCDIPGLLMETFTITNGACVDGVKVEWTSTHCVSTEPENGESSGALSISTAFTIGIAAYNAI